MRDNIRVWNPGRGPIGPFVALGTVVVTPVCDACDTYFAQVLPWTDPDGSLLVVISDNAWDVRPDAFSPIPTDTAPVCCRSRSISGSFDKYAALGAVRPVAGRAVTNARRSPKRWESEAP
jgi:hypothetical protein